MFKWLKSLKKIKVQAICGFPHAVEYFPIRKSSTMMPQWWQDLPAYDQLPPLTTNMRRCRGLVDLYGSSFVMPLWTDLYIDVGAQLDPQKKITVIAADGRTQVTQHFTYQSGDLYSDRDWIHIKISSPWVIESQLKFAWMEPTYSINHLTDHIQILPGVMDFAQQPWTHINLLVRNQPGNLVIPANTPLAHLIPLTERTVEIQCRADPAAYQAWLDRTHEFVFQDKISKRHRIKKDLTQPRCPFN